MNTKIISMVEPRSCMVVATCEEAPPDQNIFVGKTGKLLAFVPEMFFVFLTEIEMVGTGPQPVQVDIVDPRRWKFKRA